MSTFTGTETPNDGDSSLQFCRMYGVNHGVTVGGPQIGLLLLFGTSLETTTHMCYIAVPYVYERT